MATINEDSQVTLAIWSHSHAPPLQPSADISFDLRRVPNPPKHIRDNYDGRSKRLREHLLHDATFANLLQSAMQEILQLVQERDESEVVSHPEQTCFVGEDETVTAPGTGSSTRTASDDSDSNDDYDHASAVENTDDAEAQAQTVSQSTKYDPNQEEPNPASSGEIESDASSSRSLRVSISCFCERGRHRSVAFAEELGRMAWPRGWHVSVQHRDVEGDRRESERRKKKGRSGRRGGKRELAFGIGPDGDEP